MGSSGDATYPLVQDAAPAAASFYEFAPKQRRFRVTG
jgi:hypothetical protein